MEAKKIDESITNFQYVFNLNQKAINDYLLSKNLGNNELNYIDLVIISYLVYLTIMENTKFKIIEDEKYFFVNNNFLKKNLIFLNVGDRQIRNILLKLEKLEIIKRTGDKADQRYLKVNKFLIDNWNINDKKEMTASQKIKFYKKDLWESIVNEFGANECFDKWLVYFDTHTNRSKKEKLIDIASSLYDYCKKAEHNQRFKK